MNETTEKCTQTWHRLQDLERQGADPIAIQSAMQALEMVQRIGSKSKYGAKRLGVQTDKRTGDVELRVCGVWREASFVFRSGRDTMSVSLEVWCGDYAVDIELQLCQCGDTMAGLCKWLFGNE